jgi:DNA-binding PadR family transcriptional regulator
MEEVMLLGKLEERTCGVREVITLLGGRPSRVLQMLAKLELEGLVESRLERGKRGRPKKVYCLTELGRKFLQSYRDCERFRLRTSPEGATRVIRQTREVERLIRAGRSPYQMLWELDEIVRAVKNSAEAG